MPSSFGSHTLTEERRDIHGFQKLLLRTSTHHSHTHFLGRSKPRDHGWHSSRGKDYIFHKKCFVRRDRKCCHNNRVYHHLPHQSQVLTFLLDSCRMYSTFSQKSPSQMQNLGARRSQYIKSQDGSSSIKIGVGCDPASMMMQVCWRELSSWRSISLLLKKRRVRSTHDMSPYQFWNYAGQIQ